MDIQNEKLQNIREIIEKAELKCKTIYKKIDDLVLHNQRKVLRAFQENRVTLSHFAPSSGYGYEDTGKYKLGEVFASALNTEFALVSPHLASATHALSTALFGILRPNDTLLSITDNPYDTLLASINGTNIGSLKDFGVNFEKIDFLNGRLNKIAILLYVKNHMPKVVFIQRSCGYKNREALSIKEIGDITSEVKKLSPNTIVFVDNCYGTFIDKQEPSDAGVDIFVDSLIKNPGGGIAPTGAYIAGKKEIIELISQRFTAPGLGNEVGSYAGSYTPFFQGLFLAPSVVGAALKGSVLTGAICKELNLETSPKPLTLPIDMVRKIHFKTESQLIKFIQSIQATSPIDSFVLPIPSEMPGYSDMVIMASGSFNQGSSIELSCDAPIRKPYIAYMQGGLTYEHIKIAMEEAFSKII